MKRGSAGGGGRGKASSRGLPSTRASDAAERSPGVYFANLKADMLLQKQMQVLKRAENSLVHRIVIDQKILFRRFQAKLRRSKLARARLWGDKDIERELRARDLHVMNTNCGQEQDDFEFLKKLERRPCIMDEEVVKPQPARKTPEVSDKDMEDFIRAVLEDQFPPPTEKNLQSLSTIGRLMEEARLVPTSAKSDARQRGIKSAERGFRENPKISIRPVTTPAHRTEPAEVTKGKAQSTRKIQTTQGRADHFLQHTKNDKQTRPKTSQGKDHLHPGGTDNNKPRPFTSPARSQPRAKPQKGHNLQMTTPRTSPTNRRKSAHGNVNLGISSPSHGSRRPSQTPTSMFEEQKKVDLVALRLEKVRNIDLTPKVSSFLKSLLDLDRKERVRAIRTDAPGGEPREGYEDAGGELQPESEREDEEERKEELKGDRKFDYYATKMALHATSVKKNPYASLPGTPEEVNMKLVGDQTIKSITMPRLHLDYSDLEGQQEEEYA